MQNVCLRIAPDDNVVVTVQSLCAGTELVVDGRRIVLQTDVSAGQNIALIHLEAGDYVIKYGGPAGCVTDNIDCGGWVNSSNTRKVVAGQPDASGLLPETQTELWAEELCRGYRRKNGEAGIRNEIWIVAVSEGLEETLMRLAGGKEQKDTPSGIDRVISFPCHSLFMDSVGADKEADRIWQRWISHPNAGGVLVVALKKEEEKVKVLKTALGKYDAKRIRFATVKDGSSGCRSLQKQLQELIGRASGDSLSDLCLSSLRLD